MANGGEYWAEVWDLPGVGTTKYGELDIVAGGVEKMISQVKGGRLTIPSRTRAGTDFDLDSLIDVEADEGRLVKIMQATGAGPGGTEVFAFRIDESSRPYVEEAGLVMDVWGMGVEGFADDSSLPPYDFLVNPNETLDPDYIYGADSILANGDLEANVVSSTIMQLWHQGTGGTYTLSDGVDTTLAIAWNASFDVIATRLETDIASINDVRVSGLGTFAEPFQIEYIDPGGVFVPLLTAVSSLTGADTVVRVSQQLAGGVASPTGWTISYHPQTGAPHGLVTILEPSTDQVHSGTYSLKIVGQPILVDPPGAQQILSVTGGRTYRAEAWYRCSTTQTFVLRVRTMDETWIAGDEVVALANTWTQIVLPPFVIPKYINQVVFRVATFGTGILTWYVDDAVFAPGLPADTAGGMLLDFIAALQADGQLLWLGTTFTDALDSAGNAWIDAQLSLTVQRGRSLRQILDLLSAFGYVWLFNPDGSGGYDLEVWNDLLGAGTDLSATVALHSATKAFHSATQRRSVPKANRIHAEGAGGHWTVVEDAAKVAAFGARTAYITAEEIGDSVSLVAMAQSLLGESNARKKGTKLNLRDDDDLRALQHFSYGDRITIDLPPEREVLAFKGVALEFAEGRAVKADLHMEREVLLAQEAETQAILRILAKFTAPPPPPAAATANPVRAVGGAITSVFSQPGQAFLESGRLPLVWDHDTELLSIRLACKVAPTGASIIYDLNVNGTTVFAAQSARPSIAATATIGTAVPLAVIVPAGQPVTVDCDQVGSTLPGGDVTAMVRWREVQLV